MDWTKLAACIGVTAWIPHIFRWFQNMKKTKRAEIMQTMQTIATCGLCVIASITLIYGVKEYKAYKAEKRPYVSLIKVDIGSNLCKDYTITYPELNKEVFPSEIIAADRATQEKVEEIIVELCYKNTGPIAAEDVRIFTGLIAGDSYTIDGKENPNSVINENTTFDISAPKNYINQETVKLFALIPEQEKNTLFMFHRREKEEKYNIMRRDTEKTNCLYLICDLKYKSIGENDHGYFGVYKLYILPASTVVYGVDLIESKVY